ncbi:hypothetical protein ACO0K0_07080 [Undibacterium sp. SXout11W]|uniref:hypothetical protein n=1 Tax=Undibacterium sp. SXout11W TaxID=3413050 RepID=UPI003BF247DE
MELKIIKSCPLGHKCQEIKDNAIHQCEWLTKLAGKNPVTGENVDEHGCAITWLPVLLIENAQQQRSTAAAVESFRNEVAVSTGGSKQVGLAIKNIVLSSRNLNTVPKLIGDKE